MWPCWGGASRRGGGGAPLPRQQQRRLSGGSAQEARPDALRRQVRCLPPPGSPPPSPGSSLPTVSSAPVHLLLLSRMRRYGWDYEPFDTAQPPLNEVVRIQPGVALEVNPAPAPRYKPLARTLATSPYEVAATLATPLDPRDTRSPLAHSIPTLHALTPSTTDPRHRPLPSPHGFTLAPPAAAQCTFTPCPPLPTPRRCPSRSRWIV